MEKIQERALKFIYNENHSTYEELLAKSKLPSLKIRRIRSIAIETFKIINKETPQYLVMLVNWKGKSREYPKITSFTPLRRNFHLDGYNTIQYNKLYLKSENIKHYNTSSNEPLNPT
jgi:hypothetical protein